MLKICIVGAGGRMGQNIARVVYDDESLDVACAIDRQDSKYIGMPIYEAAGCGKGGAAISCDIDGAAGCSVIIDFTAAKATLFNIPHYKKLSIPVIVGSTGFSDSDKKELELLSKSIPLLVSPNMSLGVNVLFRLTELAAKSLKGYDIEISEMHHRLKKDAPSGTAIGLANIVSQATGLDLSKDAVYGRKGLVGARKDEEIGIHALRGGDVAGEHTVFFFGDGERVELTHRASSRMTFARGAVLAAKWLVSKPCGLYSMQDVLFG